MDTTLVLAAAVVMIAVGISFLFMLLGRREGWAPRDAMEWIGSSLSVALVISAVVLIVMALQSAGTPSSSAPAMLLAPGTDKPEILDLSMDVEPGNFTFRRVEDGEEATLQDLRGKVVLVNFWATWCGPCLGEIPELNKLQKEYGDEGLVVLSISDEDQQTLTAFKAQFAIDTYSVRVAPYAPLPPPFSQAFEIRPTSFVIDRDGMVRRYLLGARSYEIFKRVVTPYL